MKSCICKLIFFFTLFLTHQTIFADEGMWLPMLLQESVYHDMQNEGLQLSADDIYSINHSSLKDAVLLFGSGCTGEVISSQGLILTNHHCGFGQIQSHSTVDHDYIKNGFWAMNKNEELTCPGLTVTFVIRMEDVTDKMLKGISESTDETLRQQLITVNSQQIIQEAIAGTHYIAVVRPFYSGNKFFLIVSETYRDIRMVGAPPSTIGNFGGEADNWIWPRHNADFSVFRIYANQNNEPADYSADNIPFTPRYSFPISLKGVHEGDFAMVYGFPGRTTEYISSYGVDLIQNVIDPERVLVRNAILNIWWNDMMSNDTIRIQYASKYFGLANAWKKWQGEILGLKQTDAIGKKQTYEAEFSKRVAANADWKSQYGNLLSDLKQAYDSLRAIQPLVDFYNEALFTPEITDLADKIDILMNEAAIDSNTDDELKSAASSIKTQCEAIYKNYNRETDLKVMEAAVKLFAENVGTNQLSPPFRTQLQKMNNDYAAFASWLYNNSILDDKNLLYSFLDHFSKKSAKTMSSDEGYIFGISSEIFYNTFIYPSYQKWTDRISLLNREYMKAQMEVFPEKNFYPDANSTLRVAYGKVSGYEPRDGMKYNYFTTSTGVQEKYIAGDEDYDAPQRVLNLYQQKDFGDYGSSDGTLHTCFITTCHTTGGNSGSPVLDAQGHLIGTNFDRVWEGTMSDVNYDSTLCRNISVDIRYTLFVIDKYAGAGYLLNEMDIIR